MHPLGWRRGRSRWGDAEKGFWWHNGALPTPICRHTIKFTEACLREYALNPKPVYLVAARDIAERVGGAF
jgi:hypothetical protein